LQESNKATGSSALVSFREEDICPDICCIEDKCIVTNNYKLKLEFIEENSRDAPIREETVYTYGEIIHLRLTLQLPDDLEHGPYLPDTSKRYFQIMKIIFVMQDITKTIDHED